MACLRVNVDVIKTARYAGAFVEDNRTYLFSLWPFLAAPFVGVDTDFIMMRF
jgi:hypothetical protein